MKAGPSKSQEFCFLVADDILVSYDSGLHFKSSKFSNSLFTPNSKTSFAALIEF